MAESTELRAANTFAAIVIATVVVGFGKIYLSFQRDARRARERH